MSLTPAIRSAADVDNLPAVDIRSDLGYVGQAIEAVRAELGQDFPVLGFSGAPYTLASYMVEGGSSKSYHRIKSMMYTQPEVYDRLLVKIADAVAEYLMMQISASANAVQLFDSWAGELSVPDYRRFALPYVQRIIQRLKATGVPVIYLYPFTARQSLVDGCIAGCTVAARRSRAGEWGPDEAWPCWGEGRRALVNAYGP